MTARSFAYAIDRVATKQLASPGAPFITDSNGTNIVGAKRVNDGYAAHVSGVTAKGHRLVICLTKPDGTFLLKLAMPFFQATSRTLPLSRMRFWVKPENCIGYLALNSERPLLKNNAPLRKAINWVVDRRKHLVGTAPYSGSPWTHLLPPTYPGSVTARTKQPTRPGPTW